MKKTMAMICMAVSAQFAFAESAVVDGVTWYYSTYTENGVTYAQITSGADRYSGNLTVPATLGGHDVRSIGRSAFYNCSGLTGITLPSGIERIEGGAFEYCTALADVVLPNGLTSIGDSAFCNCDSFTRFDIPAAVESIGAHMIRECDNLKTITVAAGNSDCKVVNNCLVSYDGSTLLAVPFGCAAVDIPPGVTAIPAEMFCNDGNLASVTIPQGVTSIGGYAFRYCGKLAAVEIPAGCTTVGEYAFEYCNSLAQVSLPDGLTSIGSYAFRACNPAEIILPASVAAVGGSAFAGGNYTSRRVVLLGAPPNGIANSYLLSSSNVSYPREHGAAWLEILNNIGKFNGYNQTNKPEVEYVSVAVRENDPTILDVAYRVKSAKPAVKVRALAFKDGVRSFANVVRPETFIEDTDVNVGDAIPANAEHKLAWRVSSDWQIDLAKVKFEVLAVEEDLLPLELVTIPANGTNLAMEISWNAITEAQVFDALLWLYADKTPGLTLENGVLKNGETTLARNDSIRSSAYDSWDSVSQTYYWQTYPAPDYVFSKMGFSPLSGDSLAYANAMTRLGLRPLGVCQYAYRWIEAQ